jgi:GT2 family glycosyltransferase
VTATITNATINLATLPNVTSETVVTLNPDAYVYPGWLEGMGKYLTAGFAAVGPMSDNVGGDQFVGHLLGKRRPPRETLPEILDAEFGSKLLDTKFLVGICVMTRRSTLNEHGLLDERTELGADDLEFSWRLRMLGQRLVIAQDVFVRHEQGVSFASLPAPERAKRQWLSDAWLWRKLEAYYGRDSIPASKALWGTPIFDEALARVKLILEALP